MHESPFGPPGSRFGATGTVSFTPHVYADEGTYTITVIVTDSLGALATRTFTLTVNPVPLDIDSVDDQILNQGDALQLNGPDDIVTFHAQGTLDTHIASINWGDGTFNTGQVTENSGPSGTTVPNDGTVLFPDHIYNHQGTYQATVTISDQDPSSQDVPAMTTFIVTVFGVEPTINNIANQMVSLGASVALGPVPFQPPGTQTYLAPGSTIILSGSGFTGATQVFFVDAGGNSVPAVGFGVVSDDIHFRNRAAQPVRTADLLGRNPGGSCAGGNREQLRHLPGHHRLGRQLDP